MSLKDPNKGYTALEWSQFCGRKTCSEVIKSHLKSTSSKNTKRLSQALNETENWFKAKLNGNGNANGNDSAGQLRRTSQNEVSVNSILAKATGTSALLASLPILQNVTLPDECMPDYASALYNRRPLIIPSIEITSE